MKNNSSVLIANAYHHRSDVWASIVALAGLGGAYLGYTIETAVIRRIPWLDPVGGIAVGLLIGKTGLDLLSGNYYNLMDRQDLTENNTMMEDCRTGGVLSSLVRKKGIPCCSLRHRHHGPLVYVDLRIEVEKSMTAEEMVKVCCIL